MAMGSDDLIKEMIQIFVEQLPEFTGGLAEHLANGDFVALGALAHKAKSSVAVMGMEALTADLKKLELTAKAGTEQEAYPGLVERFIEQVTLTADELTIYAASLG
jgi:HPt (histidine-containing phosphotransfer) domain-containing protein